MWRAVACGTPLLAALTAPAYSQQIEPNGNPSSRQFETREHLQAQAALAEKQGRSSEAWLLRARLERGDFQEGDRIIVMLAGTTPTRDTLQVRSGKMIQFPQLGELSLDGVLRSELTEAVRVYLARYLTSPSVRAIPLLPIAVLGNVGAPGYYYTPADVVLRDVIMRAGGPGPAADLAKAVIRRGGTVIWKAKEVQVALADGLSLDALHLRAGDEVYVPQRRRADTQTIIAILSTGVALIAAVVSLSN